MSKFGESKTNEPDSTTMESPGSRLRRARENCDLSRDDVARHLKLGVEKIESLERGEVESIAAPVFVAGYLRSYAKLVNLSGDDIVADFKALTAMESPSMDPASSPAANDYGQVGKISSLNISLSGNNGLGSTLIVGTVIVLLVVAGYVYLSGGEESPIKRSGDNEENSGELSTKDKVSELIAPTKMLPLKSVSKEKVLSIKTDEAAIPSPFSTASKDEANSLISADISNDKVPSSELSELILYFTEDSWVDVRDSRNERLLYRIGKAGMSHTVTGLAPFNVRLGFVNGVNIVYNGESHDLSRFENRKSARFKIGKDGDRMDAAE